MRTGSSGSSRPRRARRGGRRPVAQDDFAAPVPDGHGRDAAQTLERVVDVADAEGATHLLHRGARVRDDDALRRVAADVTDEILQRLALRLQHPYTPADD